MNGKLTPLIVLMLTIAPALWAGGTVIGRALHELASPNILNFFRSLVALAILLPLAGSIYRPGSGLCKHWKHFALLGLLGVAVFNSLQYLALQTSTAINVTLVMSILPIFMMVIGLLAFGAAVSRQQIIGAVLSIAGVLVMLSHGDWQRLMTMRLVPGDMLMLLATVVWSVYSWLLTRSKANESLHQDWAALLLAQVSFGVAWAGLFALGEWAAGESRIRLSWSLAGGLAYLGAASTVTALALWSAGVRRAGPNIAGFFSNLTPMFAALMSSVFLGEMPQLSHGVAFALIVGGILLSCTVMNKAATKVRSTAG